jgi:hypothetical protein
MLDAPDPDPVEPPERDGVDALAGSPPIVSVSDIHGFVEAGRSALLTLADHPDYAPVVERDGDGLRWAGNDYVLVFNGDLIDRGPDNERVMETVAGLIEAAGPERIRVTLGNHEMGLLTPTRFGWDRWYSGSRSPAERRRFCGRIRAGHVVAAYEGHRVTYAHAGRPAPYEAGALNDALAEAAGRIDDAVGGPRDAAVQRAVIADYPEVLGLGGRTGRGPGAGVAWLDFEHMPADAPAQVVGHTRGREIRRQGRVVCQNVIRANRDRAGGEGVVVGTPDSLVALVRTADGGVEARPLDGDGR